MGKQPVGEIMDKCGVSPHDLVAVSQVPMTHKMVSRAVKGRRLTRNTMDIVAHALNRAAGTNYSIRDLFNYEP